VDTVIILTEVGERVLIINFLKLTGTVEFNGGEAGTILGDDEGREIIGSYFLHLPRFSILNKN
jgi:hypothetical protein